MAHQNAMATKEVGVQDVQIRDKAHSYGVQVNISYQFQKVAFFLAKDGFVPVLEQPTASFMPSVKPDGITGEEPPHHC